MNIKLFLFLTSILLSQSVFSKAVQCPDVNSLHLSAANPDGWDAGNKVLLKDVKFIESSIFTRKMSCVYKLSNGETIKTLKSFPDNSFCTVKSTGVFECVLESKESITSGKSDSHGK